MIREWKWRSKNGKNYVQIGAGRMDAVGAEKPSDAIPLQEGMRLLFAKGIDRIWIWISIAALLRRVTRKRRD